MPDELDQMLSSLESYWAIARRRRWWILLPVFLTWAMVWGVSWLLPSTYQSEALILLERQNVPNQYVVPNISASVQDRLQSIEQQVLSRTRLQTIIDRFHLYPQPHGFKVLLEAGDPIERMRKDIDIELVPAQGHPDEFTAFKMRYTAKSPELAQEINNELTSPFGLENVEAQQQSEDTTSFLENQLADARAKMEEQEARVAAFKAAHPGIAPGPLEMNVEQILTGLQAQLQNSHQTLEAAKQHRLDLEALIRQSQTAQSSSGRAGSGGNAADGPTLARELDKELVDLRLRLQDLQQQYTDDYPDVMALKDKIAKREKMEKLAEEQAADPDQRKTVPAAEPSTMERGQGISALSLAQLENQLKASQLDVQNYQKREGDLEAQISAYLARMKTAPETEKQMASISRDYEESKANYNSLLQKQMQSQLATRLEQRQKGEQFRIIDPPSLPNKHLAPNRFKFSVGGLILGFVLGFGMVAILELTNIRIQHEKELKALVPIPLLVSIPRLSTQSEEKAQLITRWLDSVAVTLVISLTLVGNCYAFFKR